MRGDTIAAIATGPGEGGIGIVRISGPSALTVGEQVFQPKRGASLGRRRSHTVVYGWVVDPSGQYVDEALAVLMKGPRSFTGEDVVELHCHGGQVAVRRVLEVVLLAGARLAEPGEFSRRAFLNGRMDLAQAEAVIDLIRAKTDRAMAAAVSHLRGELGEAVAAIRDRLLEMTAHLEADIDFPELELEVQTQEQVAAGCRWTLAEIDRLLGGARQGRLLREGLRVVIAGRPNVGKSSLLNRLVRENRAIVTEVPGTTRDVIEEWVSIAGLPVQLADTAGIRRTDDPVEQLGVERTMAALSRADLVLVVFDATAGVVAEDLEWIRYLPAGAATVGVVNKVDVAPDFDAAAVHQVLGDSRVVKVSAASGAGLDQLESAIAAVAGVHDASEDLTVNARQEECLRRARAHLTGAMESLTLGMGSDMVSIDVRAAWVILGEIIGQTVGEDLLDQIFSRFCIGK
ncbi:MAG: tRNA uridine-5-carboxymethylaminomethyl(34) synthesis GTPase MnmE [Bacillota bacterium]